LMSPVFDAIAPKVVAAWILEDKINVRFQIQMQKYIWKPDARGV
jgi:7-carboxy-7-deazaguanine synthase